MARTWFNQWKDGRSFVALHPSWAFFKEALFGRFFPRELNELKVHEFLTLKHDCMSVHEYGLNFTKLSPYAPKMVKNMRSQMSLFFAGLGCPSSIKGRAAILIGDMDIYGLCATIK